MYGLGSSCREWDDERSLHLVWRACIISTQFVLLLLRCTLVIKVLLQTLLPLQVHYKNKWSCIKVLIVRDKALSNKKRIRKGKENGKSWNVVRWSTQSSCRSKEGSKLIKDFYVQPLCIAVKNLISVDSSVMRSGLILVQDDCLQLIKPLSIDIWILLWRGFMFTRLHLGISSTMIFIRCACTSC